MLDEAAIGWADGPEEADVSDSGSGAKVCLSTQATRAGYLIGRIVLGTVDQEHRWSTDASDGAASIDELLQQIDFIAIASLAGEGVFDLTFSLADQWTAEHGLSAEDDEIGNIVFMAFDNALTLALVEHNIALGRTIQVSLAGSSQPGAT